MDWQATRTGPLPSASPAPLTHLPGMQGEHTPGTQCLAAVPAPRDTHTGFWGAQPTHAHAQTHNTPPAHWTHTLGVRDPNTSHCGHWNSFETWEGFWNSLGGPQTPLELSKSNLSHFRYLFSGVQLPLSKAETLWGFAALKHLQRCRITALQGPGAISQTSQIHLMTTQSFRLHLNTIPQKITNTKA